RPAFQFQHNRHTTTQPSSIVEEGNLGGWCARGPGTENTTMSVKRKLTDGECALIRFILGDGTNAHADVAERWVEDLSDGGMGSLRFCTEDDMRRFGRE